MTFNDPIIVAFMLVVAGVLGLVMGSFINCWAWRSTHGESVLEGRSHCATCGHELGAADLIPVVSWLVSGRKCRYCGDPVSARYPLTEIVCAVAFVAITAVYGFSLETAELLAFAGILLFLSLTDLDERIIPNACIIAALAVRAAHLAIAFAFGWMDGSQVLFYVLSAFGVGVVLLVIVLIADKVFARESMGGGDLKLYFVAGFYFGWQQCLFLVILSCVIGIVVALATSKPASASTTVGATSRSPVEQGDDEGIMKRAIPFGPSIAAACVITMLVGNPFVSWYLGLLG